MLTLEKLCAGLFFCGAWAVGLDLLTLTPKQTAFIALWAASAGGYARARVLFDKSLTGKDS